MGNFIPHHAENFGLPFTLGEIASRIDFLSDKMYETALDSVDANIELSQNDDILAWSAQILDRGFYGVEQILYTLSKLYEDSVASVGRELYSNKSKSPQVQLSAFMSYLRNLQLKGYLLWAIGIGKYVLLLKENTIQIELCGCDISGDILCGD